ncbi:M48 family metalloprotease [Pseudoduganella sp. RAF53_2]|uniref:M48 family metalloprotease n=1 Tax=unclassified Pseudoduganella TaxID=2637179 RepID=UPI003F96929B
MRFLLFVLFAIVPLAQAQVPDLGRAQELSFSADEVAARGEDRYIAQVVALAASRQLDRDRILLARLQKISTGLIRAAVSLKPEAADWQWELHLSSDPSIDAVCLAGGKLLVGIPFVRRLHLDDGELATLLAHEIAHAIAEHQREYFSEALLAIHRPDLPLDVVQERLDSDLPLQLRLARLSFIQEQEADQLGMIIAHRAGWPPTAMLRFYRKLASDTDAAPLLASHPDAAARISMAKGMLRLFGGP